VDELKLLFTENAPKPAGHYSQGVAAGNLLYVSGQLPVNPETGEKITSSIEEQTLQVLKNVEAVLLSGGSSIDNVIKTTVYISDISLWDRVNKVYSEFFKDHKPARAVVPTKELHYGFKIEIEAIGIIKQSSNYTAQLLNNEY